MAWKQFNEEYNKYPLSHVSTWYHKYIVQTPTKIITFVAYELNLTPNLLTTLSFLLIVLAMLILLWQPNSFAIKLLSLVFLQLGFVIDCADGPLARIKKQGSLFGVFFDPFIDRLNNFIVFLVFGILWFNQHSTYVNAQAIIIYIMAASAYIVFTIAMLIQGYVFIQSRGTMQRLGDDFKSTIIKLPYQFMNMGVHFLLLSLGYIFGYLYQVVVFYGVLSALITLALIFYLYRKA